MNTESRTKKRKVSNDEIVIAYEKKGANISATCKALDIDRTTFYNRRKASADLNEKLTAVEESLIDFAESKLMKAITEDNLTATIFYLKTKGRNRGYVERVEQEVTVNPFEELMKSLPDID